MKRRAGTKFVAAFVFLALSLSCKEDPPPLEVPNKKLAVQEAPYVWTTAGDEWTISRNQNHAAPEGESWVLYLDYSWIGNDEALPLELAVHSGGNRNTVTRFDFFPKAKTTYSGGYKETFLAFHGAQWKTLPTRITVKTDKAQRFAITGVRLGDGPDVSDPLIADPGTMMYYPRSIWRNPRYEVFTHNLYPSVLYLVSESFAVQSAFLRRLAFFVEKSGFAGRLAADEEIAGLRDWFAHDYRAEDLAAFFDLAREQNFPLNNDELLLRDLLVKNGIIIYAEGRYAEGKGALLGFSVESRDRLPVYYVHESVHGFEFTMRELQKVFLDFFDALSAEEKIFFRDAFLYRGYNVVDDRQLLASEAASYLLQQSPEETDRYFRGYIRPWYVYAHTTGADAEEEYSDNVTRFLDANPGIFGRRCAALEKEFRAITGVDAENFYDLLPKNRAL